MNSNTNVCRQVSSEVTNYLRSKNITFTESIVDNHACVFIHMVSNCYYKIWHNYVAPGEQLFVLKGVVVYLTPEDTYVNCPHSTTFNHEGGDNVIGALEMILEDLAKGLNGRIFQGVNEALRNRNISN